MTKSRVMKQKLNVYRLKLDAPDVIVPCGDNDFLIGAFTVISGYEKNNAICICYANDKKVNDGFSVSADYFEKVTDTEITYDDKVPECLFTQKEITTEQARKINGYLSKICADTAVFRMFHKKDVDEAVNHILEDAYNSVKAVLLGKGYDKPTEELLRKIDGGKVDSDAAESEKVLIKDPIKYKDATKPKDDNLEVGGNHYQTAIQPWDYIAANELGFDEGNVVKYITRHKDKNGAEDIEKVISYCKHILKVQYKKEV